METEPIDYDAFVADLTARKARPINIGGRTFHLIPPELMSDEQYKLFIESDDDDLLAIAPLMIDDYPGFQAAGGSAIVLSQIVASLLEQEEAGEAGSSPGEDGAS